MPRKKQPKQTRYITKTGLKGKRGWTDLLCNRFLPPPDLLTPNPYYKNQPEMKLWLLTTIAAIEETDEFKVMFRSADARKQQAQKAVGTKRLKLQNYLHRLRIVVPEFTETLLVEKACDSYNSHRGWIAYERGHDFTPATPDSDTDFLHRICLNYLRHRCTRYEQELENLFGKVGNEQAYDLLKQKVNAAIVEKYPWLDSDYLPEPSLA